MTSSASTVVDMFLRDHELLRGDISVLKDASVPGAEMRRLLMRFLRTLRAHTIAGEGALFGVLENFRPLRVHLLEILDEHDLAESLQDQIDELLRHTPEWSDALQAKTKVLCETVEHYFAEEERLIETGKTLLSEEELDQLRGPYARLRRSTLEQDEATHQPFQFQRPAWADAMKEMHHG